MSFDINAAATFLQGFLGEQERQRAEKKVQKAMESGQWEVKQVVDPNTGQTRVQLESRKPQQTSPLDQIRLFKLSQMQGQPQNQNQQQAQPQTQKQASPFKDFPDAFQEDGVWKVIREGKKYRIEQ